MISDLRALGRRALLPRNDTASTRLLFQRDLLPKKKKIVNLGSNLRLTFSMIAAFFDLFLSANAGSFITHRSSSAHILHGPVCGRENPRKAVLIERWPQAQTHAQIGSLLLKRNWEHLCPVSGGAAKPVIPINCFMCSLVTPCVQTRGRGARGPMEQ